MKKIKELFVNSYERLKILYLITLILWLKSYLIQRFSYDLPITNIKQELILLISPLSSSLLFLGIAAMFSKRTTRAMLFMGTIITVVLYANLLFYRVYTDFLTIPVLMQTSNMSDLGGSTVGLMKITDIFLFLDLIILFILYYGKKLPNKKPLHREIGMIILVVTGILTINLILAETERPELLTRTFDREILVQNLGTYNYLIYDVFLQTKSSTQKVLADPKELSKIEHYTKEKYIEPVDELFGIAENKNVILIALESVQSFVINRDVNGQEITPFLNDFIKESYYFDNLYHQTSQGKTSDSEFIIENSLYGLPRGAVFFTHSGNEYRATPEILKEKGYYTAVFHANNKSFWNRNVIYPQLGYDKFYSEDSFVVTDKNKVGWGLKDKEFFTQSIELMKEMPEPYYAKFLTLTNHHPFTLDEEDQTIEKYNSGSKTLNNYFPTVRYLDESLEQFVQQLKDNGMYENSVIVLYGDHYGISEMHNKSMAKYLEKEKITELDQIDLQKVPFIVHIPGMEGKTISTVSGQIDIKPTILHLLGVETKGNIEFGQDLFAKDENEAWNVLRDGTVIAKDYVYSGNACYQKTDGEKVKDSHCTTMKELARKELNYSDAMIYGDLFRYFKGEETLNRSVDLTNEP